MLILTDDPFCRFMPEDMEEWLNVNRDDKNLALALAAVHNHIGRLGHYFGETDDPWIQYAYDKWSTIDDRLYKEVLDRMEKSNQNGYTQYDLQKDGNYSKIVPFMKINGFRDGTGWWIKENNDGFYVLFMEDEL